MDETSNELYVSDTYARKIVVYDLEGNFKRKLSWEDDYMFGEIFNFDQEHLICLNIDNPTIRSTESFALISKQNGHVTKKFRFLLRIKRV